MTVSDVLRFAYVNHLPPAAYPRYHLTGLLPRITCTLTRIIIFWRVGSSQSRQYRAAAAHYLYGTTRALHHTHTLLHTPHPTDLHAFVHTLSAFVP